MYKQRLARCLAHNAGKKLVFVIIATDNIGEGTASIMSPRFGDASLS